MKHPEITELGDLTSETSSRFTEATEILGDMVRVYKLSGQEITSEKFNSWVAAGWVPEHYRYIFEG